MEGVRFTSLVTAKRFNNSYNFGGKKKCTIQATALLRRRGGGSHRAPLLGTPGPAITFIWALASHVCRMVGCWTLTAWLRH